MTMEDTGNLGQAETAYKLAASFAPEDPTPLSNLSSVKFELGQYSAAIDFIIKSLELAKKVPGDDDAAERKRKALHTRLAKCYVHDRQFVRAREAIKDVADQELKNAISSALDGCEAWISKDKSLQRKLVLDRVPRYNAHLQDVAEYYPIGHDQAESLLDRDWKQLYSPQDSISFMFCGSGDARHLFATLLNLQLEEMRAGRKVCKDVHFTLLDLKPAAIARMLILFDMMMTFAILQRNNTPGIQDATTVMAYIYTGHIIPPAVDGKLQRHIKGIIEALEAGDALFTWLFVPADTAKQVVHVLKQWQGPMEAPYYRAPIVRRAVGRRLAMEKQKQIAVFGKLLSKPPKGGLKLDRKVFDDLTVLLPSKGFAERRDPALIPLMEQYQKEPTKEAINNLSSYIDGNWVSNAIMFDVDYTERSRAETNPWARTASDKDKVPALESDPIELAEKLISAGRASQSGVLETVSKFFDGVSLATVMFSQRLKIEALVGEMNDVLERIRYDCLDGRSQPVRGIDPSRFPRKYDRIHMSNVPDYVGGIFSAAMYGRPLLREDKPANLQFIVLLNPPMFKSHGHFQSEYMLMHNEKHTQTHFSLTRKPKPGNSERLDSLGPMGDMLKMMSGGIPGATDFMSEAYILWESAAERKLPRKDLLPRPALEKWLYAHFLKIVLPYTRERFSDQPVHSPLNLTAFLRLVAHLSERGYPAHWLSGVLAALCGSGIVTTARAPRQISTDEKDVDATHPAMKMTVAPWTAQFTTLLSLWTSLLPFGFVAPPQSVVPPAGIAGYSITFPKFEEAQMRIPHFALVFWDSSKCAPPGGRGMRRMLLDDETGDTSDRAREIKRKGVHVASAFKFVTERRTASVWFRTDVMRLMMDGEWKVYLWRMDTW
ncbi:tetratricopeptide [Coniochaeta sp. 2T2.1]|nr:tetratricopeptide [Coniochaeta sp. 2T2.1]